MRLRRRQSLIKFVVVLRRQTSFAWRRGRRGCRSDVTNHATTDKRLDKMPRVETPMQFFERHLQLQ